MNRFKTLLESNLTSALTIYGPKAVKLKIKLPVENYIGRAGNDKKMAQVYAQRDSTGAMYQAEYKITKALKLKHLPASATIQAKFIKINKEVAEYEIIVASDDPKFIEMVKRVKI